MGTIAIRKLIIVLFFFFAQSIFPTSSYCGNEIIIDDYSNGLSSKWTEKRFVGRTIYTIINDSGRTCIKANSNDSASGLVYKINYDPAEYPYISWSWKTDNVVKGGNGYIKSGDDYPARVYVIFPSVFFWNTTVINYIWANKIPRGKAVTSTYTSNDIMVAVESGNENTGKWISEKRNVFEDYKRYFGKEPGKVGAIAIMTDSDNTGGSSSACYGPIIISQ